MAAVHLGQRLTLFFFHRWNAMLPSEQVLVLYASVPPVADHLTASVYRVRAVRAVKHATAARGPVNPIAARRRAMLILFQPCSNVRSEGSQEQAIEL